MTQSRPLRVQYDEQFDILEIFFQDTAPALTVELEEAVYAHIVPDTKQVVGLTIHRFREHHTQFALPFQGMLSPVSPRVALNIAKALLST